MATVNVGKCPKCGAILSSVTVEALSVKAGRRSRKGVSYVCPSCHVVLGVEIDPIVLRATTVRAITAKIPGAD